MKKLIILFFFVVVALQLNAQTIYEIQGQAALSPYAGQTVTTKGIVTAVYGNSYFIQDGDSAWTGLYIYDQTNKPALGDSLELTGLVEEYYEMTELKTITSFTTLSTGNTVPEPIVIKTGEASEKWESVFIRVVNAICTNTDLGYGEWQVNDGSGPLVVNDFGVAYQPMLQVAYTITGPLDFSFSFFKLEPRTIADIIQHLDIYFTSNPIAENIATNSFNLTWETNIEASSYLNYGLTTSYELGSAFATVSSTIQNITLENLEPGTIYYTELVSVSAENDSTPIYNGVYATQSESSGEIKTYFTNKTLEPSGSKEPTDNMVDTIIYYIEKSSKTLDIALYDLTNHAPQSDSSNYRIIQAINSAFDKGVIVRFITDDAPINSALDSLNSSIPLLKGNTEGIMHHKFLIIDAESAMNSWLVTGSVNWTYNNLFMDFNNLVCIQDQSLAKTYELEFNEMWGNSTSTPDIQNSKFGSKKEDNTPHFFNLNGVAALVYFSPSDNTTQKIAEAMDKAQSSIDFAMMAFTEDVLGNSIVSAKNRGLDVRGIIDYVEYSGSEYTYLLNNNVEVYDYANSDGTSWPNGRTLHHKYCVIDAEEQNPLVITGTHNWTASAESKNDENTLFIYNQEVANKFTSEFEKIKNLLTTDINKESFESDLTVYPNPSNGQFNLLFNKTGNYTINIFDLTGRFIQSMNTDGTTAKINISDKGIYLINISDGKNHITKKVSVF